MNHLDLTIIPVNQGLGRPNGLGLAPVVIAAAPAAGPAAPIVLAAGIVGSVIGGIKKLFGGKDDQATSYRPPSDSAQRSVQVKGQMIAFDMSNLAEAQRRGNRLDDIYSYYSVFERDNLSGASDAAKRVVQDAASKYTFGNLRDAAITLLDLAGVRKIVTPVQSAPAPAQSQGFLQSKPAETPKPTVLPPIDILGDILDFLKGSPAPPIPEYRPIPTESTRPDTIPPGQCAPGFCDDPNSPTGCSASACNKTLSDQEKQTARNKQLEAARQAAQSKLIALAAAKAKELLSKSQAAGCPAGTYYNGSTNRCIAQQTCSPTQYYDPVSNQCVTPGGDGGGLEGTIGGIPIWLLLLLAGVAIVSSGGDDGGRVSFRRRA